MAMPRALSAEREIGLGLVSSLGGIRLLGRQVSGSLMVCVVKYRNRGVQKMKRKNCSKPWTVKDKQLLIEGIGSVRGIEWLKAAGVGYYNELFGRNLTKKSWI